MAAGNPYIRDVLVIDDRVQQFYNGFTGSGPVFLIGREVRLASGFLFRARTVPLTIVADFFDANGGLIDARGPDSGSSARPAPTG